MSTIKLFLTVTLGVFSLLFIAGCSTTSHVASSDSGSQAASVARSDVENGPFIFIQKQWLDSAFLSYKNEDAIRRLVVKSLLTKADKGLNKGPYSVMHKQVLPVSGDKHDYISIGPYWWADKTKTDGLPWIRKDGKVNPLSNTGGTDKTELNSMFYNVSDLALAYYYTKDQKYAEHATKLLKVWFLDPATRMNPNLNYGQAVPGIASGRQFGIVETRWLMRLIDDMALLAESEAFTSMHHSEMKAWYTQYLNWLQRAPIAQAACAEHNNHGTFCEAQVAAFALFTGDKATAEDFVFRTMHHRMAAQIAPDGSQPDELARTRPLHYSLFNLEAYFYVARVGDHLGIDVWNHTASNGASLQKAIDFLLPSITREGFWESNINKKMRVGRLYYFLRYAQQKYNDEKYTQAMRDLQAVFHSEDRFEMAQCFLIMPKPNTLTLEDYKKIDPAGLRAVHRCYY